VKIIYEKTDELLNGKTFVVTGTLPTLSRESIEEMIRKFGGKAQGTVTESTDYLILGENPGSKYQKAKSLGKNIISEEDFLKMVK
jgi:DNA ligase (NAD+)